jgi:hypothetical protein
MLNCASEKAASTAGGIKKGLTELRVDHIHHELGYRTRSVILTRVASALQVAQNLLLEIAKQVTIGRTINSPYAGT